MRKYLLSLAFLMGLPASAASEIENHDLWTGVNGKVFRATFDQVLPDGRRVQFFNAKGERLIVEIAKLIPRDKELISGSQKKAEPDRTVAVGDPSAFKPEAAPGRALIPRLDPKNFGASNWEAMVDAVWVSLLWWEQTNVLEVPKRGDFERKAEWLHKELSRKIATAGKSAVTLEDAQKGLDEYFLENLKEVATCRMTVEKNDLSPHRLSMLCRGGDAVILKMTMTYANGRDFSICTVLESIGDGRFVFHVFGKRFAGVVKTVPAAQGDKPEAGRLEFVLETPGDLPDHYATNEPHFFLGADSWNGALVLKPYIYLVPGKISPLPPAEEISPAK